MREEKADIKKTVWYNQEHLQCKCKATKCGFNSVQ